MSETMETPVTDVVVEKPEEDVATSSQEEGEDTKLKAARIHDVVDELSALFPEITKGKLKAIADATFKKVVPDLLLKHQAIKIVDFASIQVVMRKATRRKLPNGTRVMTPEHKALRFSAYTALEEKLGMSDYKSIPEEDEDVEQQAAPEQEAAPAEHQQEA